MKKSRLESLAVFAAIALAWQRLNLGAVFRAPDVAGVVAPVNGRCPAGWIKLGNRCIKL